MTASGPVAALAPGKTYSWAMPNKDCCLMARHVEVARKAVRTRCARIVTAVGSQTACTTDVGRKAAAGFVTVVCGA